MNKNTFFKIATVAFGMFTNSIFAQQSYTTNVLNHIVFYDGYATTVSVPTGENEVRISNDKYAKKLTDDQMDGFKKLLRADVKIGALCDNYDRIGGLFISLVPKGEAVTSEKKEMIEVGRFITPFMNKNYQPTEVPYSFDLKHLIGLFKSEDIREEYDIWMELHVFGVPYAANTEVKGCADRTDVFEGTLDLVSEDAEYDRGEFFIKSLATNIDFNNYNATDVAGKTTRIINFTLNEAVKETKLHLITSNHGANAGGEEYVRRQHYVYFDGKQVLTYKPGGKSCEPFRKYNTQGNGIYGNKPMTEAQWASFNNWCPGDVIPNRIIDLGDLSTGQHTFKIDVPDANFKDKQGNFPLSLFLFSEDTEGTVSVTDIHYVEYNLYPNPVSDQLIINASERIKNVVLYDVTGKEVINENKNIINMSTLSSGTYIINLKFQNGVEVKDKILKN